MVSLGYNRLSCLVWIATLKSFALSYQTIISKSARTRRFLERYRISFRCESGFSVCSSGTAAFYISRFYLQRYVTASTEMWLLSFETCFLHFYCFRFCMLLMINIAKTEAFKNFTILNQALLFLSEYNLLTFLFLCNAFDPALFTIKLSKFISQPIGCFFCLFIKKVILLTTLTTLSVWRTKGFFKHVLYRDFVSKHRKCEKLLISRGCCKIRSPPLDACQYCVPSNFMANRQVPKFSLNNWAQSPKKTFMCPKFHANPVIKCTKCHISTNLSNFLKVCLLYCQNLFALAPTNRRFAEKNRLSGNTVPISKIIFDTIAYNKPKAKIYFETLRLLVNHTQKVILRRRRSSLM